jgi:hypothetical protein
MTTSPINRAQFDAARNILIQINPCLDAVMSLAANNCFTDMDAKYLTDFQGWLSNHAADAKNIYDTGLIQYENRPQAHITACYRKYEANQSEINLLNRASESLINRHSEKVLLLQKQGFTELEIEKVLPSPEAEIRANAGKIAALTAESKSLWAFTNDAPRFDLALIEDIDLGYYLESEKYKLANRAAA